jgi:hypothetical protein
MSEELGYRHQAATLRAHIEAAPGMARLRELVGEEAGLDADTLDAVLDAAARFAQTRIAPLGAAADDPGCRVEQGRVRMPEGFPDLWREFAEGGWIGLDLPAEGGGSGLPLILQCAAQEMFDRACVAFGMLTGATRAAHWLLGEHASADLKNEWLEKLARGEWAATICISEADAGSDVGRIRTRARSADDGTWRISGEKTWISFGDHDLAARIGHCLLARSNDRPGTAGLSLFLVPDGLPNGQGGFARNGVIARRIEHKLGLHGSPTCALGFEDATGYLFGEEGRGLSQLFTMIRMMRLTTALQGVAVAAGAYETARAYAGERRQGGPAEAPPVPIIGHADVQRQLMEMAARLETARGLVHAVAAMIDLSRLETDAEARSEAEDLCAWLLPIAKDHCGGTGFAVASQAIQVLGGAGYTREWPVEQHLRDSRIFTIYEGATGIQALDLLNRRLWRQNARPLRAFAALARNDIAELSDDPCAGALARVFDRQDECADWLMSHANRPRVAEAGATRFLDLAALAATGWIALRLRRLADAGAPEARAAATAAAYWLCDIVQRADLLAWQVQSGAESLDEFGNLEMAD